MGTVSPIWNILHPAIHRVHCVHSQAESCRPYNSAEAMRAVRLSSREERQKKEREGLVTLPGVISCF